MYQFDWANELLWASEETLSEGPSRLSSGDVQQTMLLHWQEHCIECAPPLCYSTCALYVARSDRKCARFVYGIYPNSRFSGLLDYGADVRFRRWGKLEAQLSAGAVSVQRHRALAKADGVLAKLVGGVASQPAAHRWTTSAQRCPHPGPGQGVAAARTTARGL